MKRVQAYEIPEQDTDLWECGCVLVESSPVVRRAAVSELTTTARRRVAELLAVLRAGGELSEDEIATAIYGNWGPDTDKPTIKTVRDAEGAGLVEVRVASSPGFGHDETFVRVSGQAMSRTWGDARRCVTKQKPLRRVGRGAISLSAAKLN